MEIPDQNALAVHSIQARRHNSSDEPKTTIYLRPKATLLRVEERVWHPPTDVFETPDAYYVKVELAGMKKEDIHVLIDAGVLSISGRRTDRSPKERIRYRQMEVKYGVFEIGLKLPADVDTDRIEATYVDGFLETRLPKRSEAKERSHKVTIQIG